MVLLGKDIAEPVGWAAANNVQTVEDSGGEPREGISSCWTATHPIAGRGLSKRGIQEPLAAEEADLSETGGVQGLEIREGRIGALIDAESDGRMRRAEHAAVGEGRDDVLIEDEEPTSGPQKAVELAEPGAHVIEVVQDTSAHDRIEDPVLEWSGKKIAANRSQASRSGRERSECAQTYNATGVPFERHHPIAEAGQGKRQEATPGAHLQDA